MFDSESNDLTESDRPDEIVTEPESPTPAVYYGFVYKEPSQPKPIFKIGALDEAKVTEDPFSTTDESAYAKTIAALEAKGEPVDLPDDKALFAILCDKGTWVENSRGLNAGERERIEALKVEILASRTGIAETLKEN